MHTPGYAGSQAGLNVAVGTDDVGTEMAVAVGTPLPDEVAIGIDAGAGRSVTVGSSTTVGIIVGNLVAIGTGNAIGITVGLTTGGLAVFPQIQLRLDTTNPTSNKPRTLIT